MPTVYRRFALLCMEVSAIDPLLVIARARLETLTPLKEDCGRLCGAACCQEQEEETGMLLFPGEEAFYGPETGFAKLRQLEEWKGAFFPEAPTWLTCRPYCPRDQRPLACRIFPLTPFVSRGRLRILMDRRASGICPLYGSGKQGLTGAFVEAVTQTMRDLFELERFRDHMMGITWIIEQSYNWI